MRISPLPTASRDSDMDDVAPPGFSAPASPPPPLPAPLAAEPQPPYFALTVADLAPPPLWLFRAPATGEVMGPFLISALRRSVQVGDITARDACLLRVWRQGEPEGASMSLQQALELPMLRARSLQLEMLRLRSAQPEPGSMDEVARTAPAAVAPPGEPTEPTSDRQRPLLVSGYCQKCEKVVASCMFRAGPAGPSSLCNACGQSWSRAGKPASPSWTKKRKGY
jgi:hypothetical protein